MTRFIPALACAALALVATTSCRSRVTHERLTQVSQGALMNKVGLRSYHTVLSEFDGKVGYLKVYDVREAGGPVYPWKYVYDLEWNELGFIDQYGTATRYHLYPEFQQQIHNKDMRPVRMPADSTENNVMRMLGLDITRDHVSFPTATQADIQAK
jgi:hypothetical protein